MLGGGGSNDTKMQSLDMMLYTDENINEVFWKERYKGVFRANSFLENVDRCSGFKDENEKNQLIGEALFLRAFFYYEMASFWGTVPLVLKTESENNPRATVEELYGQMASDLKKAIEIMPSLPYTQIEAGRATKWSSQALMARIYLFYTGFYGKSSLPLAGGGSIESAQVVTWLEECISSSGHQLVDDYRNLWAYTNRFTVDDYTYTKGKGLKWVENDGGVNPETLFAIKYSNFASFQTTTGYANKFNLFFGIRGGQPLKNTFPIGRGWGCGPVSTALYEDWKNAEPNDMRREASIQTLAELPNYKTGQQQFTQETPYHQKKNAVITPVQGQTNIFSYSVPMYGTQNHMQLGHTQDLVLIRFADVLLMHSELTKNAASMNLVRQRVGLPAVAYSEDALRNERRWELAFEGVRWNDMRRYGESYAVKALAAQQDIEILCQNKPDRNKAFGGGYAVRYNACKGFYKIPQTQINLSGGVLVQTEGWSSSDLYTGWK